MTDIAKFEIPYLVEDMDRHGNVRLYYRRHGRKVRIKAAVGTPEFWTKYNGLIEAEPQPTIAGRGSLKWLIELYYGSAEFKQLGERTRYVRRRLLDEICQRDGAKPVALLEPKHLRKRRDERAGTPEAANDRLKALRQVFAWGVEIGHTMTNPARDVPYLKGNPDGFHTWTVEEVRQYEARHGLGTRARLALALLLFTGARRSDMVGFGRQMVRDGWLVFTEVKGRARMAKHREVPLLAELKAAIDATPSGHLTFLVTTFGKPFTSNGFGNWFRRRCNEAGLKHCSAHGLRKAGATIAANQGATEHQLMAIYGWETTKQAGVYTKRANRKKLAGEAMHLLVPSVPLESPSVPPKKKV
jgi:integrase